MSAFHVTCAQEEGLFMRLSRDSDLPCEVYCKAHTPPTAKQARHTLELQVGDAVVVRRDGKFTFGVIATISSK